MGLAFLRSAPAVALAAAALLAPRAAVCDAVSAKADMFPFVIGANVDGTASDMSRLLPAPAGCDGFVRTEGEHFVNDHGVVRFNGVNLVGPACFPSHEEAERLAARLAHLGLNMVRLHYFDTWAYQRSLLMPVLREPGKRFCQKRKDSS